MYLRDMLDSMPKHVLKGALDLKAFLSIARDGYPILIVQTSANGTVYAFQVSIQEWHLHSLMVPMWESVDKLNSRIQCVICRAQVMSGAWHEVADT